jgi:DNA polymerase (family X)
MMSVQNSEVAEIFNRVADLLEIKGENTFRIRAYRNASRTVSSLSQNVAELVAQDEDMSKLPGIGKDLAGKIRELVETGDLAILKELEKTLPKELTELLNISGLGPKRVGIIYNQLGIRTLEQLRKAAENKKIRKLPGFAAKTEEKILEEIGRVQASKERVKLVVAEEYANSLVAHLKKMKGIKDIAVAGSFRRRRETVNDLDILVTCKADTNVMDHFTKYEGVGQIVSKGPTRSTVILRSGFHVDLRVVGEESYGAALLYFTGSREHNIAVRTIAVKKKLKLNEYGIFKGDKRVAGRTEEECYAKLNLPFIEPELRENRGEVEAAQKGQIPHLITVKNIRGDLHAHTNRTDGRYTLEQMAMAAKERGYEYIGITDHSKHVTVAHGMKPDQVWDQIKEIDRLNKKLGGIVILKSIELDILEDGSLDMPDDVLKELDLTVCSVHYKFNLPIKEQTDRIIRAMSNPYFNILAHPTGRLINERNPYEVDMERVLKEAKKRGCFVEINAHPDRLDLNDIHCRMAKEIGVKIAISTDAHHINDLDYMRFGVDQGRRGWLEPDDVLNTRSLTELKKLLKK